MANMLAMMKQAVSMQKEMKRIQKELARKTVEHTSANGTVKVTARGDMTIDSIKIDAAAVDPSRLDALERLICSSVNGALDAAKKEAGAEMSKISSGLGLSDLFA